MQLAIDAKENETNKTVDRKENGSGAIACKENEPVPMKSKENESTTQSSSSAPENDRITTENATPYYAKSADEATSAKATDESDVESEISEISAAVRAMVSADRKIGCLKTLQGHMWRKGYEQGKLKGQ